MIAATLYWTCRLCANWTTGLCVPRKLFSAPVRFTLRACCDNDRNQKLLLQNSRANTTRLFKTSDSHVTGTLCIIDSWPLQLSNSEFDANNLQLEIAENGFLHDTGQAINNISRITNLGIKFLIDDVGTGYSSANRTVKTRWFYCDNR